MINVFQLNYETRLQSWFDLRNKLKDADLETKCLEIDKWWQSAPIVSHYLHPQEPSAWPGPWELLSDNEYCTVARGLGIIYTLLLTDVQDVDFCTATDDNSEDVVLVLVDHAKYILNYWPDTVLSNNLNDFKISQKLDINTIKTKL